MSHCLFVVLLKLIRGFKDQEPYPSIIKLLLASHFFISVATDGP